MNCCADCFSDERLIHYINEVGEWGNCDFCKATGRMTIEAAELWDLFEPLVRLYEEVSPDHVPSFLMDGYGDTIDTLIKEEWDVFSCRGSYHSHGLMAAIIPEAAHKDEIGAFPDPHGLYIRYEQCWWYKSPDDYWDEFVHHVKTERRFIFSTTGIHGATVHDPRDWVPGVVQPAAHTLVAGASVWRARRADEIAVNPDPQEPPSDDELAAPPPGKARAGRANAEGISVFYGAMDAYTAAVEMRPTLGQQVWVAQWTLRRDASLVDLTNIEPLGSPFVAGDDCDLRNMVERHRFLRRLSHALSLPILPSDEQLGYIPTQYVVEVIREAGYDGVMYMSAQDPNGTNIVLFDGELLQPPRVKKLTRVMELSVGFKPSLTQAMP